MISDAEQAVIIHLGNLVPDNHILKKLKTMFNWDGKNWQFRLQKVLRAGKNMVPMDTP